MKALKIVYSRWFPLRGYMAMTVLWWCIVRQKARERFTWQVYNHENIHYAQERELLFVGFYLLYVLMFLWELRCMSWRHAYRNIMFEREAYAHQDDKDYLVARKRFAWMKEKRHWRA